jgi:dienelactone hydrolase
MQAVMGKLPSRKNLPALDIQIIDSLKGTNYTRYTINFQVAKNERLPALLYVPFKKSKTEKFPAMLVLHGTGANGKMIVDGNSYSPNHAQAKELAQRGYVVIAPDYPSFGDMKDYDFDNDRYESGTMKGIFNHMRCIDLLQARKDVNPEQIGALGLSLGGHNSMFVGAFDKRVKVVVSACGWTLFSYYDAGEAVTQKYGGKLGPWSQTRYMPYFRDKYKLDVAKIPFDFDEVITAIAPRAFFSCSCLRDANFDVNGVRKGIESTEKVYNFLKVNSNLQVVYPDAQHDFPTEARLQAYRFIDKLFKHTPSVDELK